MIMQEKSNFKKIAFVCTAVGEIDYAEYTIPFIKSYCNKYNYDFFIVDKNPYDCPPSWLGLIPYDLVDDGSYDLMISIDADFMPTRYAPPLHQFCHPEKISVALDMSIYIFSINFDKNHFFNAGLIAIPRDFKNCLYDIFSNNHKDALLEREFLWEQPYFNNWALKNRNKINILSEDWNYFDVSIYCREIESNLRQPYFRHMTTGPDTERRLERVKEIYKKEFKYFDIKKPEFENSIFPIL